MFFNAIAPLLQKGVKFTLQIEAADADLIAVSVHPTASSKASHALTAKQFVATAAEFETEFPALMASFATMTRTLAEQLEDARLVSEAAGKAAADEAASKSTKKPTGKKAGTAKAAPSSLVSGADGGDEEDEHEEAAEDASAPVDATAAAPAQANPAQAAFVL